MSKPVAAGIALAVLWLLEGWIPMFEDRRRRGSHDLANLAVGLINGAVSAVILASLTVAAVEFAAARGFGLLALIELPVVAESALALVVFDLWQYIWHRLNHALPVLWRFHAVHHSDPDVDASTALRFHTVEIVLSGLARILVVPLLGMSVEQLLLYESILLPVILFHHGNLRLPARADGLLRWVVVTPRMHWVHHSSHQPETDSNYSSVLSVWDRAFRTFRLRSDPRTIRLGLSDVDDRTARDLRGIFAMPFRRSGGGEAPAAMGTAEGGAEVRPTGEDGEDHQCGG